MALSKIDVANMLTGSTPVANGGTGLTSGTTGQFLKFTGSTTLASTAVSENAATVVDHWYLASNTTAGTAGIIADSGGAGGGAWTKYMSGTSSVTTVTTGSGGGKFSFPVTGIYMITGHFCTYHNTDDNDMGISIQRTDNNFTNTTRLGYIRNSFNSTDGTPNAYHQGSSSAFIDVDDVSNDKFYFEVSSVATNNYVFGGSGADGNFGTTCIIMRVGDT